ncbi:HAD hydrolase, family IIID [Cryptococcus depauperatus CBS 7841]|uniref:HAD hydrolase, family IIID n=1 Tax=Cryptococcus depauperatus CBS 7841 TaxID=1295531 RepID=A0AAJ8JML4_9TREE
MPHSRPNSIGSISSLPPSDAYKPDDMAIQDLEREVSSTGSIRLAAKHLAQVAQAEKERGKKEKEIISRSRAQAHQYAMWAEDPEEADYLNIHGEENDDQQLDVKGEVLMSDEEMNHDAMGHMQEVVDGLWIGDLVAASDTKELEKHGITNILSLLRPALCFPDTYAIYPLEIDDSADTDLLSHLPSCVAWLKEILKLREKTLFGSNRDNGEHPERVSEIASIAQAVKPGGVLVHCQAGMSRSASVVAAFLMKEYELDPIEAVTMIRKKRPVIEPSATFWHQLGLFYNANGKVSLKDRSTRQYYMERTTTQFINGDGTAPSMDKMAKYPASPSVSNPPTPKGTANRKIRCKICRRLLAVREHMMDHILDQAPPPSCPRTPTSGSLHSPRASFSSGAGMGFTDTRFTDEIGRKAMRDRERRGSQISDVINPLTGMLGAVRSRRSSSGTAAPSPLPSQTLYERDSNTLSPLASSQSASTGMDVKLSKPVSPKVTLPRTKSEPLETAPETASSPTSSSVPAHGITEAQTLGGFAPGKREDRQLQSADQLAARLPPHLLALRMIGSGSGDLAALSSPIGSSPASSPERDAASSPVHFSASTAGNTGMTSPTTISNTIPSVSGAGASQTARRMSLLAMTPTTAEGRKEGNKERRGSGGELYGGPPILINPKCSGYFVEPLTWMEPVLSTGAIAGKLVCPNDKCGVKIGNFDWAGMQCGCKEWVTPGFCIHRSKVDEEKELNRETTISSMSRQHTNHPGTPLQSDIPIDTKPLLTTTTLDLLENDGNNRKNPVSIDGNEMRRAVVAVPDVEIGSEGKRIKTFHDVEQPRTVMQDEPIDNDCDAVGQGTEDNSTSPIISTVPLVEEIEEEWWDLKMQWGGKVYDVRVEGNDMVYDFRETIASLTNVPPDSQKLIGLSPSIKGKLNASHDATRFALLNVKKGGKFVLVGTRVDERFLDPVKVEGEGGEGDFDVDYKGGNVGQDPRNLRKVQELVQKYPVTVMNEPRQGKRLLVLDLDYTIVDTKPLLEGSLPPSECARPGLHEFLEQVYPYYDIAIWSQTSWRWLETKLVELDLIGGHRAYKISFVVDRSCMFPVFSQKDGQPYKHEVKPLAYLWASFPQWSAKNSIHIDDLSRNFALNPGEGLKIRAFNSARLPEGSTDRELKYLGLYLVHIATTVHDFTTIYHKDWTRAVKQMRREQRQQQQTSQSPPSPEGNP